ncbi:Serine carboxypeptidase-like 26 [Hibiscus syriacus]|uniref:Serine carboxypeptidase-like 26 n=1 Tax=Hibiscus syriacus TaxID=106335 RepID=A0A6A3A3M3_HIBSY|nr:uncharacterized protein LOC120134512 [Hibiscus syriacus]KAE8698633.1 Serine carboxypeptidase-like 26 [Hibiscus syriacus]
MEVVVPVPAAAVEFNFDNTCSSPYMTAPSSPQSFGSSFFFGAPTSPTRASSFAAVPFEWEEKPGVPKRKGFHARIHKKDETNDDDNGGGDDRCEDFDFEFELSGQFERTSLSAEQLFDGGKIRPLKPPPGFSEFSSTVSSPKARAFRKNDVDPFETAIEKSRKGSVLVEPKNIQPESKERGRNRSSARSSSSSSTSNKKYNYVHKKSRSLSPFRVSNDTTFEQETSNPKSYVSSILSAISFSKVNRKWKLKDLLLFRSASEGRATSNDSFRKYAVLSKKDAEDLNNLSFQSTESVASSSRRVSAHELHYTVNRAMSEDMRRKTFLPYKQGLLGCLGFNPGMHELSTSIASLTHG